MKIKLINENFKGGDYGAQLLQARGVEDVKAFIEPSDSALQPYSDLENITAGVNLIKQLSTDASIALIVDCDTDGFTSASIIYQYLKRISRDFKIDYYLHSGKQHGLEEHWEMLAAREYELLIVPDAGSNDGEYAAHIPYPILVIDHHLVENANFAPNMTVINNQLSPRYKNKALSGAGMAYQFCRALDDAFGIDGARAYIDLAALGICADMMSGLEIENQWFWSKGFSHINNFFFMSLARKQAYSITGSATASDQEIIAALNPTSVAFYIVPLINAMIRMGTAAEKQRMFEAFIDGEALILSGKRGAEGTKERVAIESVRECVNARNHQNKIKEEITERLEQKIFKYDLLENQILFIRLEDDDEFPSELNGLIATQLATKYRRPTIVARLNDEGMIRGSMRGVSNSELVSFKDYLDSTGLMEYVMGHASAAGISIPNANLRRLHELANDQLLEYNFGDSYYEVNFDRNANDSDIVQLIHNLDKYKNIWSQQNGEALIYVHDLIVSKSDIQIMGKTKNTVKITKNGVAYIKFFATDMIEEIQKHDKIRLELVGKAKLNIWMNSITPQILIDNYEIKDENIFCF